jgi:hypothetical protein
VERKNEQDAINRLKNVPGVVEVNLVNGVYDIVVKITSNALDSLKETITGSNILYAYSIVMTCTYIIERNY